MEAAHGVEGDLHAPFVEVHILLINGEPGVGEGLLLLRQVSLPPRPLSARVRPLSARGLSAHQPLAQLDVLQGEAGGRHQQLL